MAKDNAFSVLESDTSRQRFNVLRVTAEQFLPEPIVDSFVSETRDEEGRQVVIAFFLFTETLVSEFKNPLSVVNFDFTPLRSLSYVDVSARDFDARQKDLPPTARLTVVARFDPTMFIAQFQASRMNCHELFRIAHSLLFPILRGK